MPGTGNEKAESENSPLEGLDINNAVTYVDVARASKVVNRSTTSCDANMSNKGHKPSQTGQGHPNDAQGVVVLFRLHVESHFIPCIRVIPFLTAKVV